MAALLIVEDDKKTNEAICEYLSIKDWCLPARRYWRNCGETAIRSLTGQPPFETVCLEIVNMVLEYVEVHVGGFLHFYFLDSTELESETEEECGNMSGRSCAPLCFLLKYIYGVLP